MKSHHHSTSLLGFATVFCVCLLLACGCSPDDNASDNSAMDADSQAIAETQPTEETRPVADTQGASDDEPTSIDESKNSTSSSVQPAAENLSTQANNNAAASDESVVISGDLQSVDWNSLVGKAVSIEGELIVVDTHDLVRRGQVVVARDRLSIPTNRIDPNDADPNQNSYEGGSNIAEVTEAQKLNDTSTVTLDDGSAKQNIFPPALFPELGSSDATVRLGSKISGVSGRMVKAGSKLLLVMDQPVRWTPAPRPSRPSLGDADVTVASFNVLNYFTTIDDRTNNARGADSDTEFQRQESKLVAAIQGLQADVIGLMEIENNLEAEQQLVASLNNALGQETFRGCGLPDGFRDAPGGADAIRVGMIYRTDRVTPIGEVSMIKDDAFALARTPIVQSFRSNDGGQPFTVVVNHFKSKGGASDAAPENKNKGDGQGAFNAARRAQALAIASYVDEMKTGDSTPRVLIIGDLNAYQQEDPIDALRASGFVDLHEQFQPPAADSLGSYSYVYYGQCGSLDHALASSTLASDVTGVATWHINADEPRFLDYNQEYNPKSLYKPDPFRSSDHDPVLIGITK